MNKKLQGLNVENLACGIGFKKQKMGCV